ncbi:transcription antitermination factor NusB [Urechidicola sp. KH5]
MVHTQSDNLTKEEKFLKQSIDKMSELHALLLNALIEVRQKALQHIEVSKKKYLASSDDINPNTKFVDNKGILALLESQSLAKFSDDKKLTNWELDDEFINIIWSEIRNSPLYERYINNESQSFEEDQEFLIEVFKRIVAPNEKLADYFEDKNLTWVDDIPFVNTWIVKDLGNLKPNKPYKLGRLYKDEQDEDFVVDLFRKVILNFSEFDVIIDEKTPNWETERIADIDLILMKMALCEFIHFASIPTRVSINEYIEIAKDYSSQKSSFFINGVLDKILKQYNDEGKIKKMGRGLL